MTLGDIQQEFTLEMMATEKKPAARRARIRRICRECASSLMGYLPNEFVRLQAGTCGVCNRERMVTDPKHFNLSLR